VVGLAAVEGGAIGGHTEFTWRNSVIDWLPLAAAEAQQHPMRTAVEPTVPADPAKTLLFGAGMAVIMLATFAGLSRFAFPGSPNHAIVAGLLIATSMGAISQTLLPEVLIQVATRWVLPEAARPEVARVAQSSLKSGVA
jgi:hypothetical protein